jgi:hypothetical protein
MNYQITIVRKKPSPNFAQELEECQARERNSYRYGPKPGEYPQIEITKNALIVELTDKQFAAVKKAALEAFS